MHILSLCNGSIHGNSKILLKAALKAAAATDSSISVSWIHIPSVVLPRQHLPFRHNPSMVPYRDDGKDQLSGKREPHDREAVFKALVDAILGPYADVSMTYDLRRRQEDRDTSVKDLEVDQRTFKPRVAGFIAVGASNLAFPEQWTMALPTLQTCIYPIHSSVVDQVVLSGYASPGAVLADSGNALGCDELLGRRVASQMGKPYDEAQYLGPQESGSCTYCHLLKIEFREGNNVACITCGANGILELGSEGNIRPKWEEDSTVSCMTLKASIAHKLLTRAYPWLHEYRKLVGCGASETETVGIGMRILNNFFGKSQISNSVCIDLRSISFCEVNNDGKTARVGGGILFEKLIGDFQSKGYSTVTDWHGCIMDGDVDLLKGIRGVGGGFGVTIELTIRIFPQGSLLSGQIFFDESKLKKTVTNICRETQRQLFRDPSESLYMAPLFVVTPLSKAPFCHVMWLHEDQGQGKKEVEKVAKLGPFVHRTVKGTTHLGALDDFRHGFAMPGMIGNVGTISVFSLTDEVTDVIAHHVDIMLNEVGLGFAIHIARQASSDTAQASCFPATERHFMLEFLGCADSEEKVKMTDKWLKNFMDAIRGTDQGNILPSTYINLTAPGQNTLRRAYGLNYDFLMDLKKKYDQPGVFNTAPPFVTLASDEELLCSGMVKL
ncbi:6-hydroxy-D-nicotine oxidase [Fusarium agapanthi]|uniref:6-hydroxy-D-nicotine oxidase n=1 Tax=Fusarium agapanthi TaxID=1803897 RepID=A0A9P5B7T3_9HYPO|nr:6-hydroxy-D-nicotine oxidase [Fusarium agapanthi]